MYIFGIIALILTCLLLALNFIGSAREENTFWLIFVSLLLYGSIGMYILLSLPHVRG